MKQLLLIAAFFSLPVFLLTNCDNTVDVNAPWEEITIVYGMLDPNDTTHYIRVNKAFLNKDRDANEIAKNEPDSLYHNHPIRVRLQELNNGTVQEEVRLQKTRLATKEPGLFPNPNNILYKGQMPLNPDYNYRILVDSLKNQERVTATTPIIGELDLNSPNSRIPGRPTTLFFAEGSSINFEGRTGANAHFYSFQLQMTFVNIRGGSIEKDTFTWDFFPRRTKAGNEPENFSYELDSEGFFNNIRGQLATNSDNLKRPLDSIATRVTITGGAEAVYNYLRVNNPSISIVQTKPEYTNVNNGRGIFSSKRVSEYNFVLSNDTKDSLTNIPNLHFRP